MAADSSLHTVIPESIPVSVSPTRHRTVADLLHHVCVPPERIRMTPPPGTATEDDRVALSEREGRSFELIDGVLVEKSMGAYESALAIWLGHYFGNYLVSNDLGQMFGADGAMRILSSQTRIPDFSFVSWERCGQDKLPKVPKLAPNLAVEIVSEGNTDQEMERKLREYFEAGVELVWYIYPETRTAHICTSPKSFVEIDENGLLDGGNVLPGLTIPLGELFARADGSAA